jgi:chromosome partitioning protein
MPIVAVVNPKGGVGKTTLATNLAGYFATRGLSTMLGDADVQQSARQWLKLRAPALAPIQTWEMNGSLAKPPKGVTHVVIDTPAAITGRTLTDVVKSADKIIVPLTPSMFDVMATQKFLEELKGHFKTPKDMSKKVAIVGMRVDVRTKAAEQLARFIDQIGIPVAGYVRDTQNYVHLAAHGMTVFDVPSQRVDQDRQTWASILTWINSSH